MSETVREVIQNVLKGDLDSFAIVVQEYQEEIWRIASFSLQDRSGTEDLVQRVFIQAYAGLEKYDPAQDFGIWLRTIARNMLRNEARNRIREQKALHRYHQHLTDLLDNDTSAEHHSNVQDALARCTAGLGPEARELVNLRYWQGLDFSGIADKIGRTVAASRQMLVRIRGSLRQCIEERMAR